MNNFQIKSKVHLKNVKPTFTENLKEFCLASTFHGLKFVGDDKLSYTERTFFGAAFVLISAVSVYFIANVYHKWAQTPVIISINPSTTYINNIPFPAITICNMNQATLQESKKLLNESEDYGILHTLCNRDLSSLEISKLKLNSYKKKSVENFIRNISQPCSRMLLYCSFASANIDCNKVFRPVLTDEGLCCSFNGLHGSFLYKSILNPVNATKELRENIEEPVMWTAETGYPSELPKNFYPRKGPGTGTVMGLSIILDAEVLDYYCSSTNGAGFKVAIHSPVEAPQVKQSGLSLDVGTENRVRITPMIDTASSAIRSVNKKYRQCLFDDETQLLEFEIYTRNNCEMECEAQTLAQYCNCIFYYMPAVKPDLRICGLLDKNCTDRTSVLMASRSEGFTNCSEFCLPSCHELRFRADAFISSITRTNFTIMDEIIQKINANYVTSSISKVDFFYEENAFRGEVKEEFVGVADFLSSTGGLLGLFLGCSFISVVEIIYFSSLRPMCAKLRYKREFKRKISQLKFFDRNENNIKRIATSNYLSTDAFDYNVEFPYCN